MLPATFLTGLLLAAAAHAGPVAMRRESEGVVLFKRNDVLTPRDLELADMHGVNLTESKCLTHCVMRDVYFEVNVLMVSVKCTNTQFTSVMMETTSPSGSTTASRKSRVHRKTL